MVILICALIAKYTYDVWGNVLSVTNVTGTEISGGVGYGLGAELEIYDIDIGLKIKSDLVRVTFSPVSGFDVGSMLEASASFIFNFLSIEEVQYDSYLDPSKSYTSHDENAPDKTVIFLEVVI